MKPEYSQLRTALKDSLDHCGYAVVSINVFPNESEVLGFKLWMDAEKYQWGFNHPNFVIINEPVLEKLLTKAA